MIEYVLYELLDNVGFVYAYVMSLCVCFDNAFLKARYPSWREDAVRLVMERSEEQDRNKEQQNRRSSLSDPVPRFLLPD